MAERYILAGAGKVGRRALAFLGAEKVAAFYDGKKHGGTICGKRVIGMEELRVAAKDCGVVLTVTKPLAVQEVVRDLTQSGIQFIPLDAACAEVIEAEAAQYDAQNTRPHFAYDSARKYFIWQDRAAEAGTLSSYFWQDLWAAQRIFENKPNLHYDIGSRIDGFIAHLSAFGQRVCLLDIRPLGGNIPNVTFQQCDATNLDGIADGSIESLSALCSLEHFGLGRYGDLIDPEACFQCFAAITKKLAPGGRAYISVPIGKEHIEFNAHRVFYAETIVEAFRPLTLVEFSSACREQMERGIDLHKYDDWDVYGGDRFGLFEFVKKNHREL